MLVFEKCRAIKHTAVDLPCSLPRYHDKPQGDEPGTWHESELTERREITYDGARHVIVTTETVIWSLRASETTSQLRERK